MLLKYVDAGKRSTFHSIMVWDAYACGYWVTSYFGPMLQKIQGGTGRVAIKWYKGSLSCRCSVILWRGSSAKSNSLILSRYLTVMPLSNWSACRYYHTILQNKVKRYRKWLPTAYWMHFIYLTKEFETNTFQCFTTPTSPLYQGKISTTSSSSKSSVLKDSKIQ